MVFLLPLIAYGGMVDAAVSGLAFSFGPLSLVEDEFMQVLDGFYAVVSENVLR